MKMRRLFAAALAATTLLGTALPTMADTTTSYPNLTACPNPLEEGSTAKFNWTYKLGDEESMFEFDVWGAASDWSSVGYMSETEVNDVEWEVIKGSTSGVSVEYYPLEAEEGKWYSAGIVTVADTAKPGLAVVEARNSQGGYTDFTVVINSDATVAPVTGIRNVFYDATGTEEKKLADATCASVSGNGFYGNSNYPSPLDCFSPLMMDTKSKIGTYYADKSAYDSYILEYVTIDGQRYTSSMDWGRSSWQYRVYGKDGQMKAFSEIVGMDDFELESGDTIVWKYGAYGITFNPSL